MTERVREVALIGFVASLLAAALAFDVTLDDAEPARTEAPSSGFFERAVFCPTSPFKEGVKGRLTAAPATDRPTSMAVTPLEPDPVEVSADQSISLTATGSAPIEVTGYGGPAEASAWQGVDVTVGKRGSVTGSGATNCAAAASRSWYFPAGSSVIGSQETLVVSNPFPAEAVVNAFFVTSRGQEASAQLSDLAVSAGETKQIDVSAAALPEDALGIRLEALRGRVVAWKSVATKIADQAQGYQFSLGATEPSLEWFFPQGEVSPGATQIVTLMNPSDQEATVSIALSTGREVVQASRLLEIGVPPSTIKPIQLSKFLDKNQLELGAVSVHVQVDNEVPIVAENTVRYSTGEVDGVSTELGAPTLDTSWIVGPPAKEPDTDVVVLMNPGGRDALVDIEFLTEEGELESPASLQELEVPSGLRLKVPVESTIGGQPLVARVVSDSPIAVERYSSTGSLEDVASVMGQPASIAGSPTRP